MRIEVVWPVGYEARFAPDLEVMDERGRVVVREGDIIEGACVTGTSGDPLLLRAPFE